MGDALTNPVGGIPIGVFVASAIPILIALGWLFKKLRALYPAARRVGHFIDDLAGEPARPGQPARPGFSERLANLEQNVTKVMYEVRPNGGGSMRDQLFSKVDAQNAEVTELKETMTEFMGESKADRARIHAELAQLTNAELAHEVESRMGDDPPND